MLLNILLFKKNLHVRLNEVLKKIDQMKQIMYLKSPSNEIDVL